MRTMTVVMMMMAKTLDLMTMMVFAPIGAFYVTMRVELIVILSPMPQCHSVAATVTVVQKHIK